MVSGEAAGQRHNHAERHQRDRGQDDLSAAEAPCEVARDRRGDRAQKIDDEDEADRRLAQREGRRREMKADVIVGGDEGAHEQEAERVEQAQAGVAEVHPDRGPDRDELRLRLRAPLARKGEGEGRPRRRAKTRRSRPSPSASPRIPEIAAAASRPPMPPSVLPAMKRPIESPTAVRSISSAR